MILIAEEAQHPGRFEIPLESSVVRAVILISTSAHHVCNVCACVRRQNFEASVSVDVQDLSLLGDGIDPR